MFVRYFFEGVVIKDKNNSEYETNKHMKRSQKQDEVQSKSNNP